MVIDDVAMKNWARNVSFAYAGKVERPESVEDVRVLVKRAVRNGMHCRIVGTGHSFNRIADPGDQSYGMLISLEKMRRVVSIDAAAKTATVEAGITYGELCPEIHAQGLALHNLASLPHVSIAGAVATGTHGSGMRNKNLSTSVVGVDIIDKNGALVCLKKGDESFCGAVVSAGSLGVVVRLTLQLVPAFDICQTVYDRVDLGEIAASQQRFERVFTLAYSVSIFTRWEGAGNRETMLWLKEKVGDPKVRVPDFLAQSGAVPAVVKRHPIIALDATPCTEQMGSPGPWFERLAHFKYDATPSVGDELQSEFFVPVERGAEAIRAILALGPMLQGVLATTELRVVDADNLWMSPAFGRASLGMHFTWRAGMFQAVWHCARAIESILDAFDYRPHFGKVFTCDSQRVKRAYSRCELGRFRDLQAKLGGSTFANAFFKTYVLGEAASSDTRKSLQGGEGRARL